ncbi:MAG TPA: D-glycero-beta-D-manno-heptose 1-phosphate adenylyltransferase, partial [Nitrospiria bacterium]|nr:D-glycero-beta-D-manno-heptose 1-phosphate adenylyltransferase [Nitrospiria bacterium]
VKKLKGPGRPLMAEGARAELVAGFSCTDYVLIFPELTVEKVLRELRPHIHAKGSDYTPDTVPEREIVRSIGGRVAIVGGPKVRSTRNLVKQVAG